jgi:hypothetical protein
VGLTVAKPFRTPSTGGRSDGWPVLLMRPDLPLMRAFRGAASSTLPGLGRDAGCCRFSLRRAFFEALAGSWLISPDLHLPRLSILEAGFGFRLRVSHVATQTCLPEGLHGRVVGPSVPGEAAPGPSESLASARAEPYPAWV